jgi:hypothetical protein
MPEYGFGYIQYDNGSYSLGQGQLLTEPRPSYENFIIQQTNGGWNAVSVSDALTNAGVEIGGGGTDINIPGGYGFVYRAGADYFDVREGELLPTDTRYADYEGKIMKYVNGSWQAMSVADAIGSYYTKAEIDALFANIRMAEGGSY